MFSRGVARSVCDFSGKVVRCSDRLTWATHDDVLESPRDADLHAAVGSAQADCLFEANAITREMK